MGTGKNRLKQSSPFCITFGCLLVGDIRLVEAVGHEKWIGNFCHVVSKHDIVPHMLLIPFESILEPLITVFLIGRLFVGILQPMWTPRVPIPRMVQV